MAQKFKYAILDIVLENEFSDKNCVLPQCVAEQQVNNHLSAQAKLQRRITFPMMATNNSGNAVTKGKKVASTKIAKHRRLSTPIYVSEAK